jgi:hypothetical protein
MMTRGEKKRGCQLSALSFQLGLALVALVGVVAVRAWADAPPDMGANVTVTVDRNGDTTLDVNSGNVKVKSSGAETRVGAGESVRTSKGKPLKKVLRAPPLTAPAQDASLGTQDVGFAWQKVPGATRYVLEVSSAPELSSARTQTVDGTRGSLHLEPGTWYWRVVALDAEGVPGRRTLPRRLTIDTTPPRLKTGKPEWR